MAEGSSFDGWTAPFFHSPSALSHQPLSLIFNLPHVWGEGVEREQLARVRTFERDLEIREERVVGCDVRLTAAARRDRSDARCPRARGVDEEALACRRLGAPLERGAQR